MSIELNTSWTFEQCARVNIEFEDLCYTVKAKNYSEPILSSISGFFQSGEITAILGYSGSGKTTLLNILSGCILKGIEGSIKINGKERKLKHFHKLTTYIMQDNYLQPCLTVSESMAVAAVLQLGNAINPQERQVTIKEVLKLLLLENCSNTRVECLSGGEKKRLMIALEVLNNPPVIFLDEPMSGLDTIAINQCMEVLRTLASQGRTVVCTVHQPSVLTFKEFDQVYFMADGMCIYNGSTTNIIPFLSSVNLNCPITHSPAEFVIESAQLTKVNLSCLVNAIQNGKINKRDFIRPHHVDNDSTSDGSMELKFAQSFWMQFYILFSRMMIQRKRNKFQIGLLTISYVIIAVTYGLLFEGIGNNAELAMENFKLYLCSTHTIVFIHMLPPAMLFPTEFELLKREYFNRWYGLKPFFLALISRYVPTTMLFGLMYVSVTYIMTDQPLEWQRFLKYYLVTLLMAFAGEACGLAIGCVCSQTIGAVVAPLLTAWWMLFAYYGVGYGETIGYVMKSIMHLSLYRVAVEALQLAVFENRSQFECSEEMTYCFYKDPKHVLQDVGVFGHLFWVEVLILTLFLLFFQLLAFLALRYRLSSEFAPKVSNFITKVIQYNK